MQDNEDPVARKRRKANERKGRWMQRQSQETLARIQEEHAASQRSLREVETQQHANERRAVDATSHRRRYEELSTEQLQIRAAANLLSNQRHIEQLSPQQLEVNRNLHVESQRHFMANRTPQDLEDHRINDNESHRLAQERRSQAIRAEAINFVEDRVDQHNCGPLNIICNFCNAKHFIAERPSDKKFRSCCHKGKIKLPKPKNQNGDEIEYPEFLQSMLSDVSNPNRINFRENIRSYNSAVSFASMGAHIVALPGRGPYVFKTQGQTYHRTSHMQPLAGEVPQFAQLYVIDSTQATEIRQNQPANDMCKREILDQIDRFFRQYNRLAESYQLMRNVEAREYALAVQRGESIPLVSMILKRDRQSDTRRYNAPTSNEVAMVFVNEDGEPPLERDIRIYPNNPVNPNQSFIPLNILSPNMDPMTYSIFYPYGEAGWQPKWRCQSYEGAQLNAKRFHTSMLQYKAAQTAIRETFNPVMNGGKLTQQWLVDSYLQVEANNLNFIRQNQEGLRKESYGGLKKYLENQANNLNMAAGVPVILPSTFEGSPRNMKERCADAMSIFAKWGAPDLFITFTANPTWPEVIQNLRPGEQTSDRPDLIARVFKIKLDSLLADLTKHGVLGKSIAFVYSIEFQKRGLPHSHILVKLRSEDRFTTSERIDQIVSAEIPTTENPRLREIVLRCMMHGPCGIHHSNAPCMKDGICSKNFPKDFCDVTNPNINGFPLYRRRAIGQAEVRGVIMDNQRVVPYSPYLALKYNAHINVEVCSSLKAIKYIYKYIFKGYDCANVAISSNGEQTLCYNEITNFINCRYVSAPEAIWRLREYHMHDRSHNVCRLPVHLPNQQTVFFEQGNETAALLISKDTMLESWFKLNTKDPVANQWLYTEIPEHYVYDGKNRIWKTRQRGGDKVIARMHTVSVKDEELFYLRILILHIRGAKSFEHIKTVDGVECETFKAAALLRGLLDSDDEWDRCLSNGGTYLMPRQLRDMFAYICCFCHPSQPLKLWDDHKENLSMDFSQRYNEEISKNKALHDINFILLQHGLSCEILGLPKPTGIPQQENPYDQNSEKLEAEQLIGVLNLKQREAFDKIVAAMNDESSIIRCFYIDGPGGSGKTFLYKTLMAFVRGRGQVALPFATTGIAATLLKGGRTVHSGFKLPVPILDTSVSSMRLTSPEAAALRAASLVIIDEVSMLQKDHLRCIDKLLRDIMGKNLPFGGKTFVVGGDFRQTLPVKVRGSRTEILEICIKYSPLWHHFTGSSFLTLSTNMRSEGENEHNEWLLQIGMGNMDTVPGIYENDTIQIPQELMSKDELITSIFENVQSMSIEDLSKRVIVAPTNAQTLVTNQKIISSMPGNLVTYYSADSIVTEDSNDALNFPIEFLNEQTPSGMPPHILLLKKGVIIMLLRNLNPKKGLCNGTRLIVEDLARNFIKARIISECNRDDFVFIPRMDLAPSDTVLPFILKRRQFPIIPAYAITINKSQGQTFDYVGIDLQTAVFSHGQLYVALSRSRKRAQVKVYIHPNPQQGNLLNDDRQFTKNIVYKEIV